MLWTKTRQKHDQKHVTGEYMQWIRGDLLFQTKVSLITWHWSKTCSLLFATIINTGSFQLFY